MNSAAEVFADHILAVRWEGLPPAAQDAARTFLHDTICVGVAGRNGANADRICSLALQWGGREGSGRVLGRPGVSTSAAYAAFINAFQIHCQEFDCVHEAAVAHPMATVVAALLADATRGEAYGGDDFLCALVAGVDVVATLGIAATTPLKFFRPATAGIFGSVAALARLRGLDRLRTLNAFGHALSFASGTMQAHLEGKPTLAVQVAAAARSAIEAIDLAASGLSAPSASIDGPFGYLSLFEDGHDLDGALAKLGKVHHVTQLSWKPFPTGRAAHGAIMALQTLMRDGQLSATTLDRFIYRAPPLIVRLVGRRPFIGMDAAYARLCFPYLGAVTLARGGVGLGDFTEQALTDPAIHALAERFIVEDNGIADPAAFVPATAVATLTDTSILQKVVSEQFGSPAWPLSREEHLAKAQACLVYGGLADAAPALERLLVDFESVPDAGAALSVAFGC